MFIFYFDLPVLWMILIPPPISLSPPLRMTQKELPARGVERFNFIAFSISTGPLAALRCRCVLQSQLSHVLFSF
jgi:hypothetical protein